MSILDFTSSDYLSYRHSHAELRPWQRLTTGRPAVLGEPRQAMLLAAELARRTGRAAGALETSTLHALVDAWTVLAAEPVAALVDEVTYPIGRLALRANGVTATVVRHFDPRHVSEVVRTVPRGRRVVLLVDGLCPGCGQLAPLDRLAAAVAPRRGVVLVDDTQSVGLAGLGPTRRTPYGRGGGGTAAWLGLPAAAPVLIVASTAKAYGAPLAVVTGPARLVSQVRRRGPSRTHGSGPSAAAMAALAGALATEPFDAAQRRHVVAALVRRFRSSCRASGLPAPDGGRWPTQTVPVPAGTVAAVHDSLLHKGVRAVMVHRRCRPGLGIAFLITADHTPAMIDRAVRAVAQTLAETGPAAVAS
jgi:8-amino-7-oxononanoate synthase